MDVNDLARIIEIVDAKSKVISEVTGLTKGLIAKDPDALQNRLAEYLIKNHFGEPMYDMAQKLYHKLIGVDIVDVDAEIVDTVQNFQDAGANVNVKYVVRNKGD